MARSESVSVATAAELCGVCTRTIRRWIARDVLRATSIPYRAPDPRRRWRVLRASIDALLERRDRPHDPDVRRWIPPTSAR